MREQVKHSNAYLSNHCPNMRNGWAATLAIRCTQSKIYDYESQTQKSFGNATLVLEMQKQEVHERGLQQFCSKWLRLALLETCNACADGQDQQEKKSKVTDPRHEYPTQSKCTSHIQHAPPKHRSCCPTLAQNSKLPCPSVSSLATEDQGVAFCRKKCDLPIHHAPHKRQVQLPRSCTQNGSCHGHLFPVIQRSRRSILWRKAKGYYCFMPNIDGDFLCVEVMFVGKGSKRGEMDRRRRGEVVQSKGLACTGPPQYYAHTFHSNLNA